MTPNEQSPIHLHWFRDDLRLDDNPAFLNAARLGARVVCFYILDEATPGLRPMGGATKRRLHQSLAALQTQLANLGLRLDLLHGPSRPLIQALIQATQAGGIFWNRRYDGPECALDADVKSMARDMGLIAESFNGALLAEPWEGQHADGRAYKTFTSFWRARTRLNLAPPRAAPNGVIGADWPLGAPVRSQLVDWRLMPTHPDWATQFPPADAGEQGAEKRLAHFLSENLDGYVFRRHRLDISGCSDLSAHLRFGEISPHRIFDRLEAYVAQVPQCRRDSDKFRSEIGWRDFNYALLFNHPDLAREPLDSTFEHKYWRRDEKELQAWCQGRTGYPLIDAAMRCLWATGTMPNRARMVCASFLSKHLLIDWREGEAWFWDCLTDADIANNPANWQWCAGCGADAAPWFRIFNPILQSEKFDPNGVFIAQYCPELARLPTRWRHRPFEVPPAVAHEVGFRLGSDYPSPIVDLSFARRRALSFRNHRLKDDPHNPTLPI